MQTEPQEDTKGTQFPEAMTVEEADKLWFQDKTIAAQRKVYSLDQIWRFLSVQISQSDIIINKMRELDDLEHKEGD